MNKSKQPKQQQLVAKKKASRNGASRKFGESMVKMEVPAAVGFSIPTTMPNISGPGTDSVRIRRREFVGSFTNGAATTFYMVPQSVSTPGWDLNPGCTLLFPWLSGIAAHFERYHFRALKFQFVSSAATSNPGRYYAALDYDYDDVPATDKLNLMGNRTANEASIWQPMELIADPRCLHRDMQARYVSSYSRGNYVEPRTAYCGFLMVGIDTTQTDRVFDMWVEYDVDLLTPATDNISEVDSIFGLVPPAVANVTTASGGVFQANPYIRPVPTGPVRVVEPGNGSVPLLTYPAGGVDVRASNALDIGQFIERANRQSTLALKWLGTETGVSPGVVIGTKLLNAFAGIYNSAGTYLADWFGLTSGQSHAVGFNSAADSATVGAQASDLGVLSIWELIQAYPNARYIVPYIISNAAIGAGTSAFGFKIEL